MFSTLRPGKKKDEIVIGTVKTLKGKYGIDYLIRAFGEVLNKCRENSLNKNLKLLIYGEGEQKEKLRDLTKKLGLENKIIFKGYIENKKVPEAINKMDIFCVPSVSNSESFGVAAVEAMACGVPVISSNADGFTEVMKNEVTGYIVPKKTIGKLSDKIYDLVVDEEKRKIFGENGRRRVLELYDWNKNVDNMIEIYRKIIGD